MLIYRARLEYKIHFALARLECKIYFAAARLEWGRAPQGNFYNFHPHIAAQPKIKRSQNPPTKAKGFIPVVFAQAHIHPLNNQV